MRRKYLSLGRRCQNALFLNRGPRSSKKFISFIVAILFTSSFALAFYGCTFHYVLNETVSLQYAFKIDQ